MPRSKTQMQIEKNRWQPATRFFHWAIALLILLAITLGFLANEWDTLGGSRKQQYLLFMLHKSIGLTVLLLAIGRVIAKLRSHPPQPLPTHTALEKRGAHFAHLALYALMFSLPITGWWLNSIAGVPLKYFLLFEVPGLVAPQPSLESLATLVHTWLAITLISILLLHFAGAAKHHWFDKDSTLTRMLPTGVAGGIVSVSIALLVSAAVLTGGYSAFQQLSKASNSATTKTVDAKSPQRESKASATASLISTDAVEKYIVLPASKLTFKVTVLSQEVEGSFKNFDAQIVFNPNTPGTGHIDVTINTTSIFTDNSTRDEMLPEPDWFSTKLFPTARFKTLQIAANGESYIAPSELTIRGITRPLDFLFSWRESSDGLISLIAETVINRMDFNIGAEEFPDKDTVSHNVKVIVELQLQKQSG